MEGGTFQSKSLAASSRKDAVFVFLHQTQAASDPSYAITTREYFEEDFFHPAYVFLRPDGTELDKKHRNHHLTISAGYIDDVFAGIRKEWGSKGLSPEAWEKTKASLAEAEEATVAGDPEKARGIFKRVAGSKTRCGAKDRALAALRVLDLRASTAEAWQALEGIDESLRAGVGKLLSAGDLGGALLALDKAPGIGVGSALAGFRNTLLAGLKEAIRLSPARLDRVFLSTGTYYYLRAQWATDLPVVNDLAVQLSYVTSRAETREGYAVYDAVRPYGRHRACVSMTSRDFGVADLSNARVQLWLGKHLLHESLFKAEPSEFPEEASHVTVGPDLLDAKETLGANVKADLREYEVGRR